MYPMTPPPMDWAERRKAVQENIEATSRLTGPLAIYLRFLLPASVPKNVDSGIVAQDLAVAITDYLSLPWKQDLEAIHRVETAQADYNPMPMLLQQLDQARRQRDQMTERMSEVPDALRPAVELALMPIQQQIEALEREIDRYMPSVSPDFPGDPSQSD